MTHRIASPRIAVALLSAVLCCLALAAGPAQAKRPAPKQVDVMTRNLYLGADLTPAIQAPSLPAFIEANGAILRQVEATNFPVRARGLAREIRQQEPDLVGLQEVALWRTAPPSLGPVLSGTPSATTVKYDFLQLLLRHLNQGKKRYRVVVAQDEFDFEAPADANGVPGDGPPGILANAEINGRLTMRDVILARVGAGVKTFNPASGNFQALLVVKVAGKEIPVTRGWTRVDAKVRGSWRFRFVNTHLEAFDPETAVPSVRAQQAAELIAAGGPARSRLPVILVGDLNSDVRTEVKPGDAQAYQVLLDAGFRERARNAPLSCCIDSYDLRGGSAAEFNHRVDHVMTDTPRKVKLRRSAITGRRQQAGYWNSDHAGVSSSLSLLR